jgi:tetratricopeptide (TPR) repeat protein
MSFAMHPKILRAMWHWSLAVAVALLALGGPPARATISRDEFDAANKLYDAGVFTEAAAAYEKLLQSGQAAPALYFNLGNAFFKAGEIGRAIAAYRRAEQLAPRDPDIRANLGFARNQVQGPTHRVAAWQRALGQLTLNEWTWLAAGSVWLCLFILTLVQLRPALKPLMRNYLVGLGLIALCLCGCLGLVLQQTRFSPTAIVVLRDAGVRQGPLDESKIAFTGHDGAELQVIDQKDNWLEVRTDPQHFGWVRSDQVLMLNRNSQPALSQR